MSLRSLRAGARSWVQGFQGASRAFDGYAPWSGELGALRDWPTLDTLDAMLRAAGGPDAPRAIRQGPKLRGARARETVYDATIIERGAVPTRERSWHDVMNALVWMGFPQSKRSLHERQYRALCSAVAERFDALPGARTGAQDALSMFDEGGVLWLVERGLAPALEGAFRALDRGPAREAIASGRARLWVFGHGILESVLLTGALVPVHALAVVVACGAVPTDPSEARAVADSLLADALACERAPALDRPRPSVTLDERWLASLPSMLEAEGSFG
jgi:hypothetical protein